MKRRVCVAQEKRERIAAKFQRVDFLFGTITGEKFEFVAEIGRISFFYCRRIGAMHAWFDALSGTPLPIGDSGSFCVILERVLGL